MNWRRLKNKHVKEGQDQGLDSGGSEVNVRWSRTGTAIGERVDEGEDEGEDAGEEAGEAAGEGGARKMSVVTMKEKMKVK